MSANLTDPALTDVFNRRMLWRCRRGLLELDIVLQRFIGGGMHRLSQTQLAAFDGLLDMTDHDLWALLSGQASCQGAEEATLLSLMRAPHREEA